MTFDEITQDCILEASDCYINQIIIEIWRHISGCRLFVDATFAQKLPYSRLPQFYRHIYYRYSIVKAAQSMYKKLTIRLLELHSRALALALSRLFSLQMVTRNLTAFRTVLLLRCEPRYVTNASVTNTTLLLRSKIYAAAPTYPSAQSYRLQVNSLRGWFSREPDSQKQSVNIVRTSLDILNAV